jgi:hypothetical protein
MTLGGSPARLSDEIGALYIKNADRILSLVGIWILLIELGKASVP